jgi:hypothetical protein
MDTTATATRMSAIALNVLWGAWLILSPFILGFAHSAAGIANNIAVGIALILLALAGMGNGLLKGLPVLLGAWLFASAIILNVPAYGFMWTTVASEGPYPRLRG